MLTLCCQISPPALRCPDVRGETQSPEAALVIAGVWLDRGFDEVVLDS